jgi:hypothetical protein
MSLFTGKGRVHQYEQVHDLSHLETLTMRSLTLTGAVMLAASLLTTLACDSNPTQPASQPERPSAAVTAHEHLRLSGPVENDCTGEVFTGTGKINTVNTVTDDGAGGVHETIHLNGQFAGTSETTGVQYVGNQVFNTEFNSRIGEEHTVVYMFTLIGQGSVPNEKSTFQFHITVLPDLTVTSYIDDFHIRCQ